MDAIAWAIRATPFLEHDTVQNMLDIFRKVEVPLESTLLLRYYTAKTPSRSILSAIAVFDKLLKSDKESSYVVQLNVLSAITLLLSNNEQANLAIYKSKLIDMTFELMQRLESFSSTHSANLFK